MNSHFDKRNSEVRRASAQGGNIRNTTSKPFIDPKEQITNREMLEAACANLCHGTPDRYPIFGLRLKGEERGNGEEKFPVIVFYGSVDGHDLEDLILPEYWISISSLFRNPINVDWKNASEELLTRQLWIQPEIQLALATVREEKRTEQDQRRQEKIAKDAERIERQQKVLAQFRSQELPVPFVTTSVKAVDAPDQSAKLEASAGAKSGKHKKLEKLADILQVTQGTIEHDGLTIAVGEGPNKEVVVRVKKIPPEHEMVPFIGQAFFAKQTCLFYSSDSEGAPNWEGNSLLSYKLRTYLRKQLIAAGIELLPPLSGETVAQAENVLTPIPTDFEKSSVTVVAFDAKRSGLARRTSARQAVAVG